MTEFKKQSPDKEWAKDVVDQIETLGDLKIIVQGLERIERKLNLVLENQNVEVCKWKKRPGDYK